MTNGRDPLPPERGKEPGKAFLIFDGECSVCRNAVEWIRARAAPETFEYLSCHSEDLPRRFPHIEKSACLTAMHLVLQDGSVLAGERAVPEILLRLRRFRWAAALFRLPGARSISRAFYRRFAARRHDISRLLFPGGKTVTPGEEDTPPRGFTVCGFQAAVSYPNNAMRSFPRKGSYRARGSIRAGASVFGLFTAVPTGKASISSRG